MKTVEFNINNYIFVQLTDIGRAELKKKHDEMNEWTKGLLGEFSLEEDKEGWSKWQMWELMSKLGCKCGHGSRVPFYTTIKIELK